MSEGFCGVSRAPPASLLRRGPSTGAGPMRRPAAAVGLPESVWCTTAAGAPLGGRRTLAKALKWLCGTTPGGGQACTNNKGMRLLSTRNRDVCVEHTCQNKGCSSHQEHQGSGYNEEQDTVVTTVVSLVSWQPSIAAAR